MDEDSIPKTSFVVPQGQYEFLRMVFGLKTAPRTFQSTMTHLFRDIPNAHVFLDDILIATANDEENLRILRQVFERIDKNRI